VGSKTSAKRFLALYFLIFFGAIFLRIDYFPLSWVPMYGFHVAKKDVIVAVGDKDRRSQGFDAWRANGEQLTISASDLNVPGANFRRLYNQRAFNQGPPQDDRERPALMRFNRWWYETFVGPDPRLNRRYALQLLESVNKTFGYGPTDPRRIVRLQAEMGLATFARGDVARGELSRPVIQQRTAMITEKGAFISVDGKVRPMSSTLERESVE
jgi:hypothetical protein